MAVRYDVDETQKKMDYSMLKRSCSYLKPYPVQFITIFVLGLFSTICFLVFSKILGNTLDTLMTASSMDFLWKTIFSLSFVLILGCLFRFFRRKLLVHLKMKISICFRNDLFQKLEKLPQRYYDNVPHGKIYTRVSHYVEYITYVLCEVLLDTVLQIITFLIVFCFLFSLNVALTFLTLFLVVFFFLFYVFLTPRWLKVRKKCQNKNTNATAYLSEMLKGVKITQAFSREEESTNVYVALLDEVRKSNVPNYYLGNLNWSLSHILETMTTVCIYVLGFSFYFPELSVGSLVVFASYTTSFWNPIAHIAGLYDTIIQAVDYLERVYDLLDYEEEKVDGQSLVVSHGEVELKHVSFSYVPKQEVLHDVSMKFPAGKNIAIVGHTGSGKSTIIQLLSRLYEHEKGDILIDGQDIKQVSLESLRNHVMTMSQDGYLFSKTIYENLVLSKKDVSLDTVKEICKQIHIDEFISNLPNGYDTLVVGNGSDFSVGQKQMLCLARILIQNPSIAILDEATSNVDVLTERAVVDTFFQVFQKRTTIVIAHRLSTIVNSDLIFVMDHGRLVEQGTHQELMKQKGKYYHLYQSQTS